VGHTGKDGVIAIWSTHALGTEGEGACREWRGIDQGKRHCVCSTGADEDGIECQQVRSTLVVKIEAEMAVCCITWSSDESIVVAAGWQKSTARAWYVPTGMPAQALAPLRRMVCAVEWLVGHWLCAGGGGDEVILLWSIEPGVSAGASGQACDPVARLATGGRTVISLSCSSDGKQLVALLSGQVLRVFDLVRITQALTQQRNVHYDPELSYVNQAWFGTSAAPNYLPPDSPHHPPAFAGMTSRLLEDTEEAYDVPAQQPQSSLQHVSRADAAMSEEAGAVADESTCMHAGPLMHGSRGYCRRRECIECQSPLLSVDTFGETVGGVSAEAFPRAFSVDKLLQKQHAKNALSFDYLASGPYAHVRVFECVLEVCEPVVGLSYITSAVMQTPFPRDRVLLNCITIYGEPTVVEWDISCNQVIETFRGHHSQVYVTGMAAGGPGEAMVCAGCEDGRVVLWQRQSGRPVKVLMGHQGAVTSLSWCLLDDLPPTMAHDDSRHCTSDHTQAMPSYLLASASDDHSVRIWGPLPPTPLHAATATQRQERASSDTRLSGLLAQLSGVRPDASPVAPNRKLGRRATDWDCTKNAQEVEREEQQESSYEWRESVAAVQTARTRRREKSEKE